MKYLFIILILIIFASCSATDRKFTLYVKENTFTAGLLRCDSFTFKSKDTVILYVDGIKTTLIGLNVVPSSN